MIFQDEKMTNGINDQVLKIIREKTGDDKVIRKFLEELVMIESTNPAFFREQYLKGIKNYTKKWKKGEK